MYAFLAKFLAWLAKKLAAACLIAVLGLVLYGGWLFLKEQDSFELHRVATIRVLTGEREQLAALRADLEKRLTDFKTAVEVQQHRVQQAQKILGVLRELQSWWDRLFGDAAQQKANAEQIARMEELQKDSTTKIVELQRLITRTLWEKDGLEITMNRLSSEIRTMEARQSKVAYYLYRAWNKTKWYIALAMASFFLGPTLWALMMYYGFSALVARGRPIRFTEKAGAMPEVGESHVSVEAALWPGDVLRIREKFLQASDEGLERKTRFVLDWRIPVTSIACGLIELVEMSNRRASGEYRVTLSNSEDPHIELSLLNLPENGSLILRPRFLAGVIQRADARLVIRRRWQLFRWQSWVTGQFRFFEFVGPCRLIVAGSRGVRAEKLLEREGQHEAARRTNQHATIGFTPNLKYCPARAETFWSYYRGMNPLFDDLFAGQGVFLLQETAAADTAAKAGRFWAAVWNGVLKVFGL